MESPHAGCRVQSAECRVPSAPGIARRCGCGGAGAVVRWCGPTCARLMWLRWLLQLRLRRGLTPRAGPATAATCVGGWHLRRGLRGHADLREAHVPLLRCGERRAKLERCIPAGEGVAAGAVGGGERLGEVLGHEVAHHREQRGLGQSPVVHRTVRVRTARPPLVRVCARALPGGELPCACGTYSTQEAGVRSPCARVSTGSRRSHSVPSGA